MMLSRYLRLGFIPFAACALAGPWATSAAQAQTAVAQVEVVIKRVRYIGGDPEGTHRFFARINGERTPSVFSNDFAPDWRRVFDIRLGANPQKRVTIELWEDDPAIDDHFDINPGKDEDVQLLVRVRGAKGCTVKPEEPVGTTANCGRRLSFRGRSGKHAEIQVTVNRLK